MKKSDEIKFFRILQKEGWAHIVRDGEYIPLPERLMPRRIIERESNWLNEKRALYLLHKWTAKGWYEYGTVIDGGWITPKGMEIVL